MGAQVESSTLSALTNRRHAFSSSSSNVSRPSLSRSKRCNRSLANGSAHAPLNEFPVFTYSGDVEIIIGAGPAQNRYLLHRHILTRCSGFFEASTSSEWSRARPPLGNGDEMACATDSEPASLLTPDERLVREDCTRREAEKKWRYELDAGAGGGDIPLLVQKPDAAGVHARPALPSLFGSGPGTGPDCHPAPDLPGPAASTRSKRSERSSSFSSAAAHTVSFSRSLANLALSSASRHQGTQTDTELLRDYDNLFRIFYNYPPLLNGSSVADAYVQCKSLLALADLYDALAVVGPRVDHHLLQFQSRLWKQIAKYPISYLRLGYLARSKIIFQEALIHVVGQWPAGERSLRAALPAIVLEIIEDKVDELEEAVSRVEGRLFRLHLRNVRGDRVTPSNGYLDWLAISLFRQWLADNTTAQPPPDHEEGGRSVPYPRVSFSTAPVSSAGRAYRLLGSGNPAVYLSRDECKKFLKLMPDLYTRDNLRRFEKRIEELKAMARDVVRPLLGSRLELDMDSSSRNGGGLSYLTCTSVGCHDLPWPIEE